MMRRIFPVIGVLLASCTGGPFFSANVPGACTSDDTCGVGICDPKAKVCVDALDGSVTVTTPAAGAVTGGPQATFTATAKAPGAPTKVDIRIEQPAGTVKETESVTTGAGTYSATMQLGTHGLVSGPATVYATVYWGLGQAAKQKDSAPVSVTLDMDPPLISAFNSGGFWSSTGAASSSTATVSVQVADVGLAGVLASSVQLKCNGQTYQGTAGAGNVFTFSVPVSGLGVAASVTADVSCTVNATDNVNNVATPVSGVIHVDNTPPALANPMVIPTTPVGAGATIALSIDATDTGGSGLAAAVVRTPIGGDVPGTQNGNTFNFTIHGTDAQAAGLQGPVTVTFRVSDAVGNVATQDVTVNVDRKAPAILSVVVTPGPGNGYYSKGATSIPVSVEIDDTNGSGAGTVSLAMANGGICTTACTSSSSVAGSTSTSRVFSFNVPGSVQTAGSGAPLGFTVTATDAVGNPATDATHTLPIDDARPTITNVVVNGAQFTASNGTLWFARSGADIDVQADINDVGSGVNLSTVQVMVTGVGAPFGSATKDVDTVNKPNTYHVKIPRVSAGIGVNSQGPVQFQFIANDNVANASDTSQTTSTGTFSIDGTAPSAGTATPGASFYSPTANAGTPAAVTATITDTGSGVSLADAKLTDNGHTRVASGVVGSTYSWSLPMTDFPSTGTHLLSLTLNAKDNVLNAATANTSGTILIDNDPPAFTSYVPPSGGPFNGAAPMTLNINADDPNSTDVGTPAGSGVNTGTVRIKIGSTTLPAPTGPTGSTYQFSLHGTDFQTPGQQGPINFNFVASDNAGNASSLAAANSAQTVYVDMKPPTITAIDPVPAGSHGGYYSGGESVPVTIHVDDGVACPAPSCGSGLGSVSVILQSGSGATISTTTNISGAFTVDVPGLNQTLGSDADIAFNVVATDAVGNATTPVAGGVLKIDRKGPTIANIQILSANYTDATNNIKWFQQTGSTTIHIQATITDSGSGLNASTLMLVLDSDGTTQIDTGHTNPSGNVFDFTVADTSTWFPATSENSIAFDVVAIDNATNKSKVLSANKLGVDGVPPQWVTSSFVPGYPAADCDLTSDNSTFFCGHDGSTFWKKGDGANNVSFKFQDSGSGVDASTGQYTLAGGSFAGATPGGLSTNQRTFTFPADFSAVAITTSATTGAGTVAVTERAKDLVGNVSATHSGDSVNVTRVKWVRDVSTLASQFKAAPVVTAQPASQVIVGGTRVTGQDPIISLGPQGGTLWTFGGSQAITVSANMAYDPTTSTDTNHPTPILYVVTGGSLYALHVTNSGNGTTCATGTGPNCVDKFCNGGVTTGFGAPALVGSGANAVAIVADSGTGGTPLRQLLAFQTNALSKTGGGCTTLDHARLSTTTIPIGAPTATGSGLYWAYDDSLNPIPTIGIASGSFVSPNFSGVTSQALGVMPSTTTYFSGSLSTVSISTNLFFADVGSARYQGYLANLSGVVTNWPAPVIATSKLPTFAPIVSNGFVVGTSTKPAIVGYNSTNPATSPWTFTAAGTVSQPTATADGTVYFVDSTNELVALKSDGSTALWTFKGGGTSPGSKTLLTFMAPGSPPTIDSSGVVYVGSSDGRVLALISDSTGTAATSDWPTLGHDNCSSNNAAFTTCQ